MQDRGERNRKTDEIINGGLDPYGRILKKTMERNIPFIVQWELTYRCNLKCVHCYCVHQPERHEFTLAEIKSVIDALADMHSLYMTFSGGEIFMREDFFSIARYARKKGFALRLLTNGTRITSAVADEIKELNPLSVEMSLYATDAETHERITCAKGSFEKTMQAFRLLHERGVKTKVKSLIMKQNVHQHSELRKLSEKLGADLVYDFTVTPRDDGTKDPVKFRLSEGDMARIFSRDEKAVSVKPSPIVNDDTFMCSAGLNNLMISPYGDVYPCIGIKDSAGNLREQTLESVLNGDVFNRVRSTRFSELWACQKCELASYCMRCPGLAAVEDGDYLGPSAVACKTARALQSAKNKKVRMEG
ncbi:MAG: radical SAM protein [Thermodesulfovibrionia bacterium]|nr:radical SAM protein [Thermodesulfovibrionia bacterium]